ncbi:hypothetical protein Alide2_0135 [Alicycliphilus denitrificans K601]|uniref:Uncharacterized protein n=1 Tax=Alicycliphilus denitrificans (strain DSM 14773 / CIP 107495 / K601) TaxID=596154 RepID=F4GDJ0_ALIDK|nr:hypothetical protein Alide_0144 [Alicycliphilus denitrificans BC]AEB82573.1 hypothetical protein Alide2_0135 [Alicycliphilus denitrificans K601]
MSGGRQRMRTGVEMVGAVQCFLEKKPQPFQRPGC